MKKVYEITLSAIDPNNVIQRVTIKTIGIEKRDDAIKRAKQFCGDEYEPYFVHNGPNVE